MRTSDAHRDVIGRRARTALLLAALLVACLAAGCGQSGGGAIKSAISSLTASGGPPASSAAPATPAPPTTAQPTPATPAPTQAQTPQAQTPQAPSSVPTATAIPVAGSEPTSPLLWLWLGLGALAFAGIVAWIAHAHGRHRAAAAGWRSQVIDAYAKGAALQDAMSTAEAPGALYGPDAMARWSDIQRRADDLNQTLYAMREAAPDENARAAVVDVLTSLQAARSAMDAERTPGGVGGAQADVVTHRLLAFEMSLRALRAPDDRR